MKYISIFMLAALFSSIANAELVPSHSIIDFGNVDLDASETFDITVHNTSTTNDVHGLTVSMTGNSKEFSWTDCGGVLYAGSNCLLTVTFTPLHYGKKKRKLNFDGYENVDGAQNDVSLTIPVIGSSDPFNKP